MNSLLAISLGVAVVATMGLWFWPAGPADVPKLHDVYWGAGQEPRKIDSSIRPFKLEFSKQMIDDLKMRLNHTRKMQPPVEDVGWTYGVSGDSIPAIVDYWLNKYDFKKREAHLNRYPQFVTNIQGLDIHFVHVKPQLTKGREVEVLPLLIQHGWPGSVVEFWKMIPMLTTPRANRNFVFEVIAPSLPGYGFSSAAAKAGLGAAEISHVLKNLMLRLGFEKFYTQGGDWGAVITAALASLYPQHILGMHTNMCFVLRPSTLAKLGLYSLVPWLLSAADREQMMPLGKLVSQAVEETGYFHEQATKPDTIGISISDSPASLAAYLLEKFSTATKMGNKHIEDGNLLEKFNMDELIDNLMFGYWVPNKAASAVRIYAESFNSQSLTLEMEKFPVEVLSACAQFPHELVFFPEVLLRDRFKKLVSVSKLPRGGHFAAFEEPQLLADDFWAAVHKMRNGDTN